MLAVSLRAVAEPVAIALAETGPMSPAELFALAAERAVAEPTTSAMLVQIWAGAAADAHKQTPHYATWRDTVAPMMAAPRSAERYETVSPDAAGWRA